MSTLNVQVIFVCVKVFLLSCIVDRIEDKTGKADHNGIHQAEIVSQKNIFRMSSFHQKIGNFFHDDDDAFPTPSLCVLCGRSIIIERAGLSHFLDWRHCAELVQFPAKKRKFEFSSYKKTKQLEGGRMTPSDPTTHPAPDLLTCCDHNKKEMGILSIHPVDARRRMKF